jgi:LDH2 family malate/lactate/ureidoglycolate dehydrogenase
MTQEIIRVPVEPMRRFVEAAFIALGVPEEDARVTADVLLAADLRGIESHGIGRLKVYTDRIRKGQLSPTTEIEIVRDGPAVAVLDGHHGMGPVIGCRAMKMAIEKAKAIGLGAVAVRNSSHFGIAGYYPLMAVREGLVGVTVTNARPAVLPTFGAEPMFGTNPIAFGAPTDGASPFLFDAATSVVPRGKLEVLSRAEEPTPAGWVGDRSGSDATDTDEILHGLNDGLFGLYPLGGAGESFGGHKGYGLATIVEILCASLQGGAFLKDLASRHPDGSVRKQNLGHFFLAIDIAAFGPPESFREITGNIVRRLRAAPRVEGEERIYTAGEKEWENESRIREQGIPVNPNLRCNLESVKEQLSLEGRDLPF